MGSPAAVVQLLTTLLATIHNAACLTECTPTPDGGQWYDIRVDLGGSVGKSLTLPAAMLDAAFTDYEARRSLRRLLRAAIRVEVA
jgi:hypothetical protein